jgi:DNA-binding response OmpR family regulator
MLNVRTEPRLLMNLLVVEDECRMLELLHRGLTEEGHTVSCATDGREGLRMVSDQHFDVVILDVMMPKLGGFEMAHQMRTASNFTPVLMLSAKDTVPDIVNGLDLGADDYMTKPFSFHELLVRLSAITRRKRTSQPTRLQIGGLLLNRVTHEVFHDGVRIALTKREYCLLERLMREAGSVVSREALVESVWGSHSGVETNTLDAYIRLLRNKIEGDYRGKLIRTARGAGYFICPEEQA